MIHYKIRYMDHTIKEIKVNGHAMYGDYGNDIVCAAVSMALIVTANAIETLGFKRMIELDVSEGHFHLQVKENHPVIEGLLKNLNYTMYELEAQYNANITVHKEA